MSSLFRVETLEGKVSYTDVERTIMHDATNDEWYGSALASKIVNDMFPIKMPYYPSSEKYKVYGETIYADDKEDKTSTEDCGVVKIYYIITPDNERVEVNKEFKI